MMHKVFTLTLTWSVPPMLCPMVSAIEVQEFSRMVVYLSFSITSLSVNAPTLQELLKKDDHYQWNAQTRRPLIKANQ